MNKVGKEDNPKLKKDKSQFTSKKRKQWIRKYYSLYSSEIFSWNENNYRSVCTIANESVCPNILRRHIETKYPDLKD